MSLLALALCAQGCGSDEDASGPGTVTVYVSMPLSGERAAEGRAIVRGAREALADAGRRVGDLRIRAVFLDDTGGGRRWDMAATGRNARRAVEDASAVAFIGDLDSGATRISLPITTQAGLLQVSPGATGADLTRRITAELEPDRYRPSEEQTFARLVPDDRTLAVCRIARGPLRLTSPFSFPAEDYGYEAMKLVLDAVGEAGADRGEIVDEVVGLSARPSRIGTYSISEDGSFIAPVQLRRRLNRCAKLAVRPAPAAE